MHEGEGTTLWDRLCRPKLVCLAGLALAGCAKGHGQQEIADLFRYFLVCLIKMIFMRVPSPFMMEQADGQMSWQGLVRMDPVQVEDEAVRSEALGTPSVDSSVSSTYGRINH